MPPSMRTAPSFSLSRSEQTILSNWAQDNESLNERRALRAKIILAAAEGKQNCQIAEDLGIQRRTAAQWRTRFHQQRLAGLEAQDTKRGRRPLVRLQHEKKILEITRTEKPSDGDRWTSQALAKRLGVSTSLVQRVWKAEFERQKKQESNQNAGPPSGMPVEVIGLFHSPDMGKCTAIRAKVDDAICPSRPHLEHKAFSKQFVICIEAGLGQRKVENDRPLHDRRIQFLTAIERYSAGDQVWLLNSGNDGFLDSRTQKWIDKSLVVRLFFTTEGSSVCDRLISAITQRSTHEFEAYWLPKQSLRAVRDGEITSLHFGHASKK